MKVIGLTGGTGAGKTTVLRMLQSHGAVILDCDKIYYEMLRTNEDLRRDLVKTFGEIFLASGDLDRKKLGNLVYGDEGQLQRLNAIVYYHMGLEVRRCLQKAKEGGARLAAIDAINLMDSGLGELCDLTVAVTAPEEARLSRIMERDGIDRDYALSRIRAQKPEKYYARRCHAVLRNDGTESELIEKARTLFLNFM